MADSVVLLADSVLLVDSVVLLVDVELVDKVLFAASSHVFATF